MDILALLACLQSCLTPTTVRQLSRVTLALVTMTGRVTMAGIARWTDDGASCELPAPPGLARAG